MRTSTLTEGQTQEEQTHEGQTHEGQTHERQTHEGQTHEGQTHEGQTHEGQTHEGQTHEGQTHEGQTPGGGLTAVVVDELLQVAELGAGRDVVAAAVQLPDLVVLHVQPLGVIVVQHRQTEGAWGRSQQTQHRGSYHVVTKDNQVKRKV